MSVLSFRVGATLAVFFAASTTMARPAKTNAPDTCDSAFSCGALSARLAGRENDYPGAFRAIRRGCEIEQRAPRKGDALFACEQYAMLLISAGTARGGDPAQGLAMLEQMCTERPRSSERSVSPCAALARTYDRPPQASGLPRRADKAAALRSAACDSGDVLACSSLGEMYLKGAPRFPADITKAREAMEKGCRGNGHYAAGVCGSLGSMIAEGKLGAPNPKAAMPYLTKSCAQGYRCDLLVQYLLRDGRDEEALRALDSALALPSTKDELASKHCREGSAVMCKRVARSASARRPSSRMQP
jgi:TPR repeat protein